jgi:SPP1 family predicted phage head-tail adaptor
MCGDMRIGDLRHRVVLRQKEITEDELKQQSETWVNVATIWADVEPLSGREYFAAKQVNAEVSVRITIRYRKGVTPDMRPVFGNRTFEVLSVINPKERCEMLVLMCREVTA